MEKNMNLKRILNVMLLGLVMLGSSAFSQTTSTCSFDQASFTANFGVVRGGTVGRTQSVISLTCTSGLPYQLTLGSFPAQNGNIVTAYRNSSESALFSTIAITGSGSTQSHPVYLKLHRVPGGYSLMGEYVIFDASQGYSQSANITLTF